VALLRASGEALGNQVDLEALQAGSNVAAGAELVAFATAAVRDHERLDAARGALRAAVGDAALVEAAATVAVFEGLNRIADATGIQLDDNLAADTADVRGGLGIEGFSVTEGKVPEAGGNSRSSSVKHMFS
jgi:hypothetical protein